MAGLFWFEPKERKRVEAAGEGEGRKGGQVRGREGGGVGEGKA